MADESPRRARRGLPPRDRVGILVGRLTWGCLGTTAALALTGAPAAAYTAVGGIGTAAAVSLGVYLRRRR